MSIPDYEYDVFISYPHQDDHRVWVHDIFLDKFKTYLTEELGRPSEVFVDLERGKPGNTWPLKLKNALARSRVIIPVWSVHYFQSNWCKAECSVMLHRESQLGFRTMQNPDGLILPIRLFDGKGYPAFTSKIDALDCTAYNIVFEGFKKTLGYGDFLKLIQSWVRQVADRVNAAPPWSATWLTPPWLDDPIRQWDIDPTFRFPTRNFVLEGMG